MSWYICVEGVAHALSKGHPHRRTNQALSTSSNLTIHHPKLPNITNLYSISLNQVKPHLTSSNSTHPHLRPPNLTKASFNLIQPHSTSAKVSQPLMTSSNPKKPHQTCPESPNNTHPPSNSINKPIQPSPIPFLNHSLSVLQA